VSCHDRSAVINPKEAVVHYPVAKGFCTGCHAPHAAREPGLLKDTTAYTCFTCHAGIEAQTLKPVSHRPVEDGACLACHRPHTSVQPDLLVTDTVALCASCHARHARFTHPMGEKARDPSGRPITCTTCHAPHGADFKYLGRAEVQRDLCLRCHKVR